MYTDRVSIYREIEHHRKSKVISYVTGDRVGLETSMASDVVDFLVHHLDEIGVVEKISLIVYTRGGETLSAWTIANLLRTYCDHLEIIVPAKCHSAGTLLCLAADTIVMTKQATLGPIDPSVNTPLNPPIPGSQVPIGMPVNVEDVNAFIEHARHTLSHQPLDRVFEKLAESVHPLVLGNAFRARAQIRMLGERLLSNHMDDMTAINKVIDFLCSESGSHDYTINRREARNGLGLPIETPSWEFYRLIKALYDDFSSDLRLTEPFDRTTLMEENNHVKCHFNRALIESIGGGTHQFTTDADLIRSEVKDEYGRAVYPLEFRLKFEGWRHFDE